MTAMVNLREVDWPHVRPGMRALVAPVAFMHTNIESTVSAVDPAATPSETEGRSGRFFRIHVLLNANRLPLRPGMTAIVDLIVTDLTNALVVPLDAVFEEDGENICYIANTHTQQRQRVQLGSSDGIYAVVEKGLEEGQEVYTEIPSVGNWERPVQ